MTHWLDGFSATSASKQECRRVLDASESLATAIAKVRELTRAFESDDRVAYVLASIEAELSTQYDRLLTVAERVLLPSDNPRLAAQFRACAA